MRVLIACEYSGTVRDAFIRAGHDALSCDLLPSESDFGPHYQGDVFDVLDDGWDLMVAHPPCTYMASAGNRWLYDKRDAGLNGEPMGPARWEALIEAAVFFRRLWEAPIPRVAIENPKMNRHAISIIGRGPDQTVQPYHFGEPQMKGASLWLRGLPPLIGTEDVKAAMMALPYKQRAVVHSTGPSDDRAKIRSLFFPGIADAMAAQWGGDVRMEAVA